MKGQAEKGKDICKAINLIIEYRRTEDILESFIKPLQRNADGESRVHCIMNFSTDSGRLSTSRPNLTMLPNKANDQYKIRQSIEAANGNKLIVADYKQLELRIMAHLANCTSMIEDFKEGGDFHIRTAMIMFDYIMKDFRQGKVVLDRSETGSDSIDAPLISDKYPIEVKKAKSMNYSIAYGKDESGLAYNWSCSESDVEYISRAWHKSRKEIKKWQNDIKNESSDRGYTTSLIGRRLSLEKYLKFDNWKIRAAFGRAAIKGTVESGGADIIIGAMVKIYRNKTIKDLGWQIVHQMHDEIILEGPQEHANIVNDLIKYIMRHPLDIDLKVALEVDSCVCDNWYEAK